MLVGGADPHTCMPILNFIKYMKQYIEFVKKKLYSDLFFLEYFYQSKNISQDVTYNNMLLEVIVEQMMLNVRRDRALKINSHVNLLR